jgi:NADP-dependent 3-hydroxy acid dehydrogenase YdfG
MLSPEGRVVMVSGANRGIGLAVAKALHARGYTLSLGARDVAKLDAATQGLGRERVMTAPFDACDKASAVAWVEATLRRFGRIDGLVNNAGIALDVTLEDEDESAYDAMWEVNVKGPLRLIRLALPHLRRAGTGRIVNVASLSGKRVKSDKMAGYAMSKFAVMALTHAVRRAGWDDGVRATAVCPSFVATDMTDWVKNVPRAEMIQPEDLAELVATALALPNNAVVAELLVNCRLEDMF